MQTMLYIVASWEKLEMTIYCKNIYTFVVNVN